jgi:hypothetical protein
MLILQAILDGERDAAKLAEHRDRRCKASRQTIADSLVGNYRPEHLLAVRQSLQVSKSSL